MNANINVYLIQLNFQFSDKCRAIDNYIIENNDSTYKNRSKIYL